MVNFIIYQIRIFMIFTTFINTIACCKHSKVLLMFLNIDVNILNNRLFLWQR